MKFSEKRYQAPHMKAPYKAPQQDTLKEYAQRTYGTFLRETYMKKLGKAHTMKVSCHRSYSVNDHSKTFRYEADTTPHSKNFL